MMIRKLMSRRHYWAFFYWGSVLKALTSLEVEEAETELAIEHSLRIGLGNLNGTD
jgi:hypothetical protein